MTITDRINQAASGEHLDGVMIYWDTAAVGDEGTAYRDGEESGALEFTGWGGEADGSEDDTYHVSNYFGADGKYLGPDKHGVYPQFQTI
jgi:hypothetical protein